MQQATEMVLKGCADKADVNKQQPMAYYSNSMMVEGSKMKCAKSNMLASMNSEVSTLHCRIGTELIEQ